MLLARSTRSPSQQKEKENHADKKRPFRKKQPFHSEYNSHSDVTNDCNTAWLCKWHVSPLPRSQSKLRHPLPAATHPSAHSCPPPLSHVQVEEKLRQPQECEMRSFTLRDAAASCVPERRAMWQQIRPLTGGGAKWLHATTKRRSMHAQLRMHSCTR